jgi:predicted nucleotidyltransferase
MATGKELANIYDIFGRLEKENDITILCAVESGSRAWKFHSPESDYDMRFIFVRNDKRKYLSLKNYDETITGFSDDQIYDWHGWDVRKAIMHLKESNPSILEWLYSPIIYIDKYDFLNKMRVVSEKMHTSLSLMYHYKSMAYTNYMTWIHDKEPVICKKYLYVIRPVAMLQWLMNRFSDKEIKLIIDFDELLESVKIVTTENNTSSMTDETYNAIKELVIKKRTLSELGTCNRIKSIDDWVLAQFERFEDFIKKETDTNYYSDKYSVTSQTQVSIYHKLENEAKKVRMIGTKNGFINRKDYLNAIGFGLQFLWLVQNNNETSNKLPSKIKDLLTSVKLDEHDFEEIKKIIDYTEEDKKEYPSKDIFIESLFGGIVRFITSLDDKENKDKPLLDHKFIPSEMRESLIEFAKDKIPREDIIEFAIKQCVVPIYFLLSNKESKIRDLPSDPLHSDELPTELKSKLIEIISEYKPKHMIAMNDIVNAWLNNSLEMNKEMIRVKKEEILQIRDTQTKIRYNKSIKDVPIEVFDDLFFEFALWTKIENFIY